MLWQYQNNLQTAKIRDLPLISQRRTENNSINTPFWVFLNFSQNNQQDDAKCFVCILDNLQAYHNNRLYGYFHMYSCKKQAKIIKEIK